MKRSKLRTSIYGLFNFDDNPDNNNEDNNNSPNDKNDASGKKKKPSWLQGEYDQLTNRLMDFIVPRAIEEGGSALEFADVEMQKNPMLGNNVEETIINPTTGRSRKISMSQTRQTLMTIGQKKFTGTAVVDALMKGLEANSREDAIILGNKLLTLGYLEDVKINNTTIETIPETKPEGTNGGIVNEEKKHEENKMKFQENSVYKYALKDQRVTAIIYSQLHTTKGHSADNLVRHFRQMVSLKKIRFIRDGFDLDLTYITRKIIAMGFPSSALEGMYRNPMEEVQRFFKFYHLNHFKIYNLCSERQYDPESFNGAVAHWPFDDHNPCPLNMIKPFCDSIDHFLRIDDRNTVAVHCKAGKGRTGLMVCAYLVHSGTAKTADEATRLFARRRTHNEKGVTIPSQIRYVNYYERIVRKLAPPIDTDVEWVLSQISFGPIPTGGCTPSFTVAVNGETVFKSANHMKSESYSSSTKVKSKQNSTASFRHLTTISNNNNKNKRKSKKNINNVGDKEAMWKNLEIFNIRFGEVDDIRFRFKDAAGLGGTKAKMFRCWLNAQFITDFDGDDSMKEITLTKNEIDEAIKDKKYPEDFKMTIKFRKSKREEIQGKDKVIRRSSFRLVGVGNKGNDGKSNDGAFMQNSVQSLTNISKILYEHIKEKTENEKKNSSSSTTSTINAKTYDEVSDDIDELKAQMKALNSSIENLQNIKQQLSNKLEQMEVELDEMPIDEVML